jgi:N-acetylmuramoyl-L-alanine amidase
MPHWDSDGAARAFQQARQKREEISRAEQPTLAQYIDCTNLYHNVHLKDPHYGRTGDAIYEEGLLYQEMAEKFSKPEYYRTAIKRFHLLVKDYGGNQNCRDALIRMATLYSSRLDDREAAEEAYRRLKTEYGYSSAAVQRIREQTALPAARAEVLRRPPQPEPVTVFASSAAQTRSGTHSTIQNVRFWTTEEYTRVIIDMDLESRYEKSRISDPDRIYFDILNATVRHDLLNRSFMIGDERIKQVRVAQKSSEVVRIVLDLAAAGGFSVSEMRDPFRIVIDLHPKGFPATAGSQTASSALIVMENERKGASSLPKPAPSTPRQPPAAVTDIAPIPDKTSSAASPSGTKADLPDAGPAVKQGSQPRRIQAPGPEPKSVEPPASAKATDSGTKPQPPASKSEILVAPREALPTSRGDRTLTRVLGLKVGRIVIDPGHGGHDEGTTGLGGLQEKDLVLSLAKELQRLIEERLEAEVILTRDGDYFIPLEERTAIANQHKADLFISLHANSSRIRSISGVETYYLDFAKNNAEREIAARENATTENNVRDLEDLIKKIAQADKSKESRELASLVQKKLFSGARQILPLTHDRGVRSAPFIVLIGANMPSVLAEVAFISNPKDERLLNKESARKNLARALFAGIEGYMKTLGSAVVKNQTSSQSK